MKVKDLLEIISKEDYDTIILFKNSNGCKLFEGQKLNLEKLKKEPLYNNICNIEVLSYIDFYDEDSDEFYDIITIDSDNEDIDKEDNINHPSHYNQGKYETILKIESLLSRSEYIGYLKGNIIKYMDRADYKGHKEEDKQKADWYMDELLKTLQMND